MLHLSPKVMIAIGVLMMVVGGVIVPYLMVIQALESTFFMIFASYAVSVSGFYFGIIGVTQYIQIKRRRKEK